MTSTAAALEENPTNVEVAGSPVKHILHHAYACWDSEETRHFYEDLLEMPLIATVVLEDPLRNDGSRHCHTFFETADGDVLAFFEHTSLFHPKRFASFSGPHHHVALKVAEDTMVRQLKRKLDAAGVENALVDHGVLPALRFNDPNGLVLECMANVPPSSKYNRTSRRSAHFVLQQWLRHRQNWWRSGARMKC
jgi:glyoxylase I family protein